MSVPNPLRGRVRHLNEVEIDAYDVLPADLAGRVRLVRLPLPGPYAGMTLGPLVILANEVPADGWSTLLAHELVHVRQWSEHGIIGFGARYVSQFVAGLARFRNWNAAYRQIDAEQEARAAAEEWRRRRNS